MGVACDCGGGGCLSNQHALHSPIVHSLRHQVDSSDMQGFEMARGLLYLSFVKPFLPDLFITLPTLTHWDVFQLSLTLREDPRSLGVPGAGHCLPVSTRGSVRSAPLIHNDISDRNGVWKGNLI